MDQDLVARVALDDQVYQLLLSRVLANGWSRSKSEELVCLYPVFNVRDHLAVLKDLVSYTYEDGCMRLVIPESLRGQMSGNSQSGHQGLDSLLRRAR